jgi:hypothetical protein
MDEIQQETIELIELIDSIEQHKKEYEKQYKKQSIYSLLESRKRPKNIRKNC